MDGSDQSTAAEVPCVLEVDASMVVVILHSVVDVVDAAAGFVEVVAGAGDTRPIKTRTTSYRFSIWVKRL